MAVIINNSTDTDVIEAGGVNNGTSGDTSANGQLQITDPGAGLGFFTSTSSTSGTYGNFVFDDIGGFWTYTLNDALPATEALNQGDSVVDFLDVTADDGTVYRINVNVAGTNDSATITGTSTGGVTEDGSATATGTLVVSDVDSGQAELAPIGAGTAGANAHGTFEVLANGQWTYTLNNADPAVQALAFGTSITDTILVTSEDGTASEVITVNITGTNDVPTLGGDVTGAVTEDTGPLLSDSGNLTITDTDTGQSNFGVQVNTLGNNGYGYFQLDASGAWSYLAANNLPPVQALGAGDTLTDSFIALSADGTASEVVTVTFTGVNDAATISGTSTGGVTEDIVPSTSGLLSVADADSGENELVPIAAGTAGDNGHGTFEVQANGLWTYTLNNGDPAVQTLPVGGTLTDTITVTSEDGTDTQLITVTIDGSNDPATIVGTSTGDVVEDGTPTATGTLIVFDLDTGENELAPIAAGTAGDNGHGTFEVLANGQWTYTLNNADTAVQALPLGGTLTDTITVTSEDGSDTQLVTVTITGTNDVPTLGGDVTGAVTEDTSVTLTDSGLLTIADVDSGQSSFQVQPGTPGSGGYGSFTLASNGTWTYSAADGQLAIQQLGAGDTLTDSFTAYSADGTASEVVTVTITGTNDNATILGGAAGTVTEDNLLTTSGGLFVIDQDSGEDQLVPIAAGTAGDNGHGTFEVQPNGFWTYTLNNADPAVQALPVGGTLTDTITVTSQDGTDTQVITITINGDNDPATITGTSTGVVTEDVALTTTGTLIVADIDTGENELAPIAAGTTGDNAHGTFEVLANGQWTYTLNNADPAVQALAAGSSLTDTITVTSEDGSDTQLVTVTINGTNDVPTLGGDVSGAVTEDTGPTLTDSGLLTIADGDTGQSSFQGQSDTPGSSGYGSFTLATDGSWTYSADNSQLAIQQLGVGATATDSFTAYSADGTASEVVTVTLTGVNDNPVANDDTANATGPIQIDVLANDTDVDVGDSLSVNSASIGLGMGSVSVASDGLSINYDPGNAYDYLADGETALVVINYTIVDANGGFSSALAQVTVTGGNEAPVIVSPTDTSATVIELVDHDPQENVFDHNVTGTISFADADGTDTHTANFQPQGDGYLGTFGIDQSVNDADGNVGWSFTVSDAALNSLAQGEVVRQYYDVEIDDGNGGTVMQTVEVDLVGTNDAAQLSSANVVIPQGAEPVTASDQLTISDEDGPEQFVAQVSTAGNYGHFSVTTDGTWTYQADDAYVDLGEGQFLSDVFTVLAEDGTPTTVSVTITGVDEPAMAHQDLFTTDEATAFGAGLNLFADNGSGADEAVEGGTLSIAAVNGSAGNVGQTIQLASGALVRVNADGTFSYDPNHAFDDLTAATGAANQFGFDSFTYTLAGGSTATAFVNVLGLNSSGDLLMGNGLDNSITGFAGNDSFLLNQAGNDSASGLAGNDGFYFGGYFDGGDSVDGGAGIDTLALQGNTNATLGDVSNVEVLLALSGSDTRFGEAGDQSYSYDLTVGDNVVAAGETLTVVASGLQAGESMRFDGSAETDGNFRMFAGQGDDDLTGGAGNDGFFFGADGNLTGADRVDGGAGTDSLALRGNYVGADAVVFQDASFANVEVLAMLSGHTNEFSGAIVPGGFDYDVTMADGNVAAGQRLDVSAARLGSDESFRFDGRGETDGSFRILSGAGNDTLFGGGQGDLIYGGGGADLLEGGAGADVYTYRNASDSTSTGYDTITGFDYREDSLDMPGGGARAFTQAAQGDLSTGSFDTDLAAAMDGVLGTGQAALFTATGGSLAGHVFGVIDANGVAGYQAGEDYVIEFANPVIPIDPTVTVIG